MNRFNKNLEENAMKKNDDANMVTNFVIGFLDTCLSMIIMSISNELTI